MMPTVVRIGPYRIQILTNDHEPIHVHVFLDTKPMAKVFLGEVLDIEFIAKMPSKDVKRVLAAIQQKRDLIELVWRRIYGQG